MKVVVQTHHITPEKAAIRKSLLENPHYPHIAPLVTPLTAKLDCFEKLNDSGSGVLADAVVIQEARKVATSAVAIVSFTFAIYNLYMFITFERLVTAMRTKVEQLVGLVASRGIRRDSNTSMDARMALLESAIFKAEVAPVPAA